jgi:uncharacterized protein (DUF934 family)
MLLRFIDPLQDPWTALADGEAAAPHRLLTLAQWQQLRHEWPADIAFGLALANDDDVENLASSVHRASLITLNFPKWTDGRAYSQAHLLRARLRYAGQIRAVGDVVADMAPLLHRCGFDAAVLRAGQSAATAERALSFFKPLGHYQGDVIEARPVFVRKAA